MDVLSSDRSFISVQAIPRPLFLHRLCLWNGDVALRQATPRQITLAICAAADSFRCLLNEF